MNETRTHTAEEWQKLAGKRQGIVNMLDKKVSRLEAEVAALTVALKAANARNAMYDHREAS
jgi:hypothetical protein